jgi:hypothetical protein
MNKNNKKWAIWVSSISAWLEDNRGRIAKYSKKKEAVRDCEDFNSLRLKKSKVYEVKEYKR